MIIIITSFIIDYNSYCYNFWVLDRKIVRPTSSLSSNDPCYYYYYYCQYCLVVVIVVIIFIIKNSNIIIIIGDDIFEDLGPGEYFLPSFLQIER